MNYIRVLDSRLESSGERVFSSRLAYTLAEVVHIAHRTKAPELELSGRELNQRIEFDRDVGIAACH